MVTLREAAEQALAALERADKISGYPNNAAAIKALRQALEAEQQAEPVAWVGEISEGADLILEKPKLWSAVPLYTKPQPVQQPLTDEQIDAMWQQSCREHFSGLQREIHLARAIERAHGIGETK